LSLLNNKNAEKDLENKQKSVLDGKNPWEKVLLNVDIN
jgi:hypothetical protein